MISFSEITPEIEAAAREQLRQMTPEQVGAMIEGIRRDLETNKPEGTESYTDPVQHAPGVLVFLDGRFRLVRRDFQTIWPLLDWRLGLLLACLPCKQRQDYWRWRIETGRSLLTVFIGSDGTYEGIGIINNELNDYGVPVTFASILPLRLIDLGDVAKIAEVISHQCGTAAACIWTECQIPIVPGFSLDHSTHGQLQTLLTIDLAGVEK